MAVLVTGGDSGIGKAIAIACAREGADVTIVYDRHDNDARDTESVVKRAGRRCLVIKSDLSGGAGVCCDVIQKAVQEMGRLDSLIINHGVQFYEETLADVTCDNMNTIFGTNVYSAVYLAQAAEKHLPQNGTVSISRLPC